ncbi:MAG TPA: T3SS effector HopA1 family protein [Jatrophihabitans sp.]|jgi:hypothetical protein|uniref:T3SS effector HopA1 family protein n=1 Tax=Jatrophihabitans sp. TaxID=1932789 RepID=UPI002E012C59|nr:T3SS effector HopA1 family protein [Jatrophihabitans sp.]
MTTQEPLLESGVRTGGPGAAADPLPEHGLRRTVAWAVAGDAALVPIGNQGSVATQDSVADPWPGWARGQLLAAVDVAAAVPAGVGAARTLYDEWFNPPIEGGETRRSRRPLAGLFRAAHAGSSSRRASGELVVLDRHDVVGVNGWWRTWGESWTPPRTRPGSIRVMLSPAVDRLPEFVNLVTGALLASTTSWSLGCATDPRRVGRCGAAVLDLPGLDALPAGLLEQLAPVLTPVAPPLGLPLAPGVAAAGYPDNGMTFGEHRCHLIALALRQANGGDDPLAAIAGVFAAHGIDAARPHLSRSR